MTTLDQFKGGSAPSEIMMTFPIRSISSRAWEQREHCLRPRGLSRAAWSSHGVPLGLPDPSTSKRSLPSYSSVTRGRRCCSSVPAEGSQREGDGCTHRNRWEQGAGCRPGHGHQGGHTAPALERGDDRATPPRTYPTWTSTWTGTSSPRCTATMWSAAPQPVAKCMHRRQGFRDLAHLPPLAVIPTHCGPTGNELRI